MTRSAPSQSCAICQTTFADSDCLHWDGNGFTDDPLILWPTLDEDENNTLECGPAGLAGFAPPYLLDPPCVNIYGTTAQTMPYDVAQTIFLSGQVDERYDTDSMHDDSEDASRLVFKTPGIYAVSLNVRWKKATVDSGDVAVFIRQNGADYLAIDSMPIADPDLFCSHSVTIEALFETGDYVEARAKQDGKVDDEGIPLAILTDYQLPSFSAMFLRPPP